MRALVCLASTAVFLASWGTSLAVPDAGSLFAAIAAGDWAGWRNNEQADGRNFFPREAKWAPPSYHIMTPITKQKLWLGGDLMGRGFGLGGCGFGGGGVVVVIIIIILLLFFIGEDDISTI